MSLTDFTGDSIVPFFVSNWSSCLTDVLLRTRCIPSQRFSRSCFLQNSFQLLNCSFSARASYYYLASRYIAALVWRSLLVISLPLRLFNPYIDPNRGSQGSWMKATTMLLTSNHLCSCAVVLRLWWRRICRVPLLAIRDSIVKVVPCSKVEFLDPRAQSPTLRLITDARYFDVRRIVWCVGRIRCGEVVVPAAGDGMLSKSGQLCSGARWLGGLFVSCGTANGCFSLLPR